MHLHDSANRMNAWKFSGLTTLEDKVEAVITESGAFECWARGWSIPSLTLTEINNGTYNNIRDLATKLVSGQTLSRPFNVQIDAIGLYTYGDYYPNPYEDPLGIRSNWVTSYTPCNPLVFIDNANNTTESNTTFYFSDFPSCGS